MARDNPGQPKSIGFGFPKVLFKTITLLCVFLTKCVCVFDKVGASMWLLKNLVQEHLIADTYIYMYIYIYIYIYIFQQNLSC